MAQRFEAFERPAGIAASSLRGLRIPRIACLGDSAEPVRGRGRATKGLEAGRRLVGPAFRGMVMIGAGGPVLPRR
jgi:hypothetical protein